MRPQMTDDVDLLILGAGSTAFAAALPAQELNKSAVMVEERPIGGTCVNRGCLPSKNLIEAARIVHEARTPRYPGLTAAVVAVDFAALARTKDELVHDYRAKKYESLVGDHIRVEKGHARFIDSHTVEVDGKRLSGKNLLIATGSRPVLPAIEGLETIPYLTSDLLTVDEPMELTELPSSLVIVGGGYIALELGQMFSRLGSRVTILERSGQLLGHGYEAEVGRSIAQVFAAEGIAVVFDATPMAARLSGSATVITATVAGQERGFRSERLLVVTRLRPNSDHVEIERTGAQLHDSGAVVVDRHLRTAVSHLFAAGDVIGRQHGSQIATPVGSLHS